MYPGDWTYLNDVEALPDGRLMVSLRNHDQVVFLDPDSGLQENWTLGADDDHTILHEQHNPDYVSAPGGGPESGDGPAVLVADSETNRIVEYEWTAEGDWTQTWEWSDRVMRWPRDADRLPNGHTMVVDSNSGRVFELDGKNEIVWQVQMKGAYDVKCFDVPADRTGLESATTLGSTRLPGKRGSGRRES